MVNDRLEKILNFTLTTFIRNAGVQFSGTTLVEDDNDDEIGLGRLL